MGTLLLRQFPPTRSEQDIRRVFTGFGEVVRVLFLASRKGRERYAFVDMDSPESAASAANTLDGVNVEGIALQAEAYRCAESVIEYGSRDGLPKRHERAR